jgi:hypothetical protein
MAQPDDMLDLRLARARIRIARSATASATAAVGCTSGPGTPSWSFRSIRCIATGGHGSCLDAGTTSGSPACPSPMPAMAMHGAQ